jgi:two-component system phosphate regulon sensor histidine kinase PhoR
MPTFDVLSAAQLLDALTLGALVQAPDGSVCYANARLAEWLTVTPSDVLGLAREKWLSLPPKVVCPYCGAPEGKTSDSGSFAHLATLTGGSEPKRVKVRHQALPDGHLLSLFEPFAEDVALTQAHSDFVSTVSHEFRTPLTSIKGFADTLLRYGGQLPADQQKRFITIIKDQADRLTRLVENLLSVSRLGAGKMELTFRPVSLQRTVERVVQSLQAKGGSERLMRVDLPATLPDAWADPDKLEQVLLNLVDNAIKYSFSGSEVRISARLVEQNPDAVSVCVADQGVGIPAEHLPKIFTQFARIDNPLTREVEGTGLGLYITKSLTLAMGGDIRVESGENPPGSRFIVTLPVASPERQARYRRNLTQDEPASASVVAQASREEPLP